MPEIPVLAFPPRVSNGQFATVEQGSIDDLVGQVHVLCLTPYRWLTQTDRDRDYGLNNQAHRAGGPDLQEIQRQIDTYVPDAQDNLSGHFDRLAPALAVVNARIGRSA